MLRNLTSLSGDRMVSKTHGRIAFRGVIDVLEAEVIEAQVMAVERGKAELCASLGEILGFLRAIMAAEVKETPLPQLSLFGIELEEIHRQSHDIEGSLGIIPPLPSYTQGPLAVRLNTLRTKVREAELLAVKVFGSEENMHGTHAGEGEVSDFYPGEDIILALNRLSSAFWWLYCRNISPKTISA